MLFRRRSQFNWRKKNVLLSPRWPLTQQNTSISTNDVPAYSTYNTLVSYQAWTVCTPSQLAIYWHSAVFCIQKELGHKLQFYVPRHTNTRKTLTRFNVACVEVLLAAQVLLTRTESLEPNALPCVCRQYSCISADASSSATGILAAMHQTVRRYGSDAL
jgi:hypothetical protein